MHSIELLAAPDQVAEENWVVDATKRLQRAIRNLKSFTHDVMADPETARLVCSRSYTHPNGFAKVVLARNGGEQLRLHFWSNGATDSSSGDPHDHRWSYVSIPLAGKFTEQRFDITKATRDRYLYLCRPRTDDQLIALESAGRVHLVQTGDYRRNAGDDYACAAGEVHGFGPSRDELSISLILTSEPVRSFARVVKRTPVKDAAMHVSAPDMSIETLRKVMSRLRSVL